MGAKGSSLVGKAVITSELLPFTEWNAAAVEAARARHRSALGGAFALGLSEFAQLLGVDADDAQTLFHGIYDTDRNQLVDAYEVLGSVAMIADMTLQAKLDFVHALYDFNGSGDITMDELTIMMRTIVCGLAKVDVRLEEPSVAMLEQLSRRAFLRADKDADGEISKGEFDAYCLSSPTVREFLDYWAGAVSRAALEEGQVWSDAQFAGGAALYRNQYRPPVGAPPVAQVAWQRPSDMAPEAPVLFGEGPNSNVLVQGQISDLWFLSGLAVLTAKPQLLQQLFVTTGQEDQGRYCVQFFKDGKWENVYVDDRLPCNAALQPLFARSVNQNEYWPMVTEKAYAKLHGSYEALNDGRVEYALRDLTGGAVSTLRLDSKEGRAALEADEVWPGIGHTLLDGLVGAVSNDRADALGNGILKQRAYTVMQMVEVGEVRLLQLRNPWGLRTFHGDWSEYSALWDEHPEVAKECGHAGLGGGDAGGSDGEGSDGEASASAPGALGEASSDDSLFWISYEDFVRLFDTVYQVRLLSGWSVARREGAFPMNGGGCPNNGSWRDNSQFYLDVPQETDLVVHAMQPDQRYHVHKAPEGDYDKAIGFVLCEFDWGATDAVRDLRALANATTKAYTKQFVPARDTAEAVTVPPGKYVLIPMAYQPNKPGTFWISVDASAPIALYAAEEVSFDDAPDKRPVSNDLEGEFTVLAPDAVPPKHPEMDQHSVAMMALGALIADLTATAKDLIQRKRGLEELVEQLEG